MTNSVEVHDSSESPSQQWILWQYRGNRSNDIEINPAIIKKLIEIMGIPQKPLIIADDPITSPNRDETVPKRLSELFRWSETDEASVLQIDYTRIDRYVLGSNLSGQDNHRAYFAQTLASAASVGMCYWSMREIENRKTLPSKKERETIKQKLETFWSEHAQGPDMIVSPLPFLSFPLILTMA